MKRIIICADGTWNIRDQVDLVLDAGRLPGGEGSTVVDVTESPPKIIREGTIEAEKIEKVLKG